MNTTDLENLAAKDFTPLLHRQFLLASGAEPIALELMEVSEVAHRRPSQKRPPFSLLFKTSPARVFPQKIYRLEQEAIGALEVFLVPVTADQDSCCYEAVFN